MLRSQEWGVQEWYGSFRVCRLLLSFPLSPVLASILKLPHSHKIAAGASGIMSTSQEKRKSRTKFGRHILIESPPAPPHSVLFVRNKRECKDVVDTFKEYILLCSLA